MDTGTRTVSSYVLGFCLSHYEYFHYSKQKKKKKRGLVDQIHDVSYV